MSDRGLNESGDPQLHITDVSARAASDPDDLGADAITVEPAPSRSATYAHRVVRTLGPLGIATVAMVVIAVVLTVAAMRADRPVHTTQRVVAPRVDVDAIGCPVAASCVVLPAGASSVVQAMRAAAPTAKIADAVATYDVRTDNVYRVALVGNVGEAVFQIVSQCIPGTAQPAAQSAQTHQLVKGKRLYERVDTVLSRAPGCSVFISGDVPQLTYSVVVTGDVTIPVTPTSGSSTFTAFPLPLDTLADGVVRTLARDPRVWIG